MIAPSDDDDECFIKKITTSDEHFYVNGVAGNGKTTLIIKTTCSLLNAKKTVCITSYTQSAVRTLISRFEECAVASRALTEGKLVVKTLHTLAVSFLQKDSDDSSDFLGVKMIIDECAYQIRKGDVAPPPRMDTMILDEVQDYNTQQYAFVMQIQELWQCGVGVVGDPNQSIYAFQHASPNGMGDFVQTLRDSTRGCVTWSRNGTYRCPVSICDLANTVLSQLRVDSRMSSLSDSHESQGTHTLPQLVLVKEKNMLYKAVLRIVVNLLRLGSSPNEICVLSAYHSSLHEIAISLIQDGVGTYFGATEKSEDLHAKPPSDCVQLRTIHGAKGGEWRHVIVMGMNDSTLSACDDLPEELRKLYTAVTRSKETLHLICDVSQPRNKISRFLTAAIRQGLLDIRGREGEVIQSEDVISHTVDADVAHSTHYKAEERAERPRLGVSSTADRSWTKLEGPSDETMELLIRLRSEVSESSRELVSTREEHSGLSLKHISIHADLKRLLHNALELYQTLAMCDLRGQPRTAHGMADYAMKVPASKEAIVDPFGKKHIKTLLSRRRQLSDARGGATKTNGKRKSMHEPANSSISSGSTLHDIWARHGWKISYDTSNSGASNTERSLVLRSWVHVLDSIKDNPREPKIKDAKVAWKVLMYGDHAVTGRDCMQACLILPDGIEALSRLAANKSDTEFNECVRHMERMCAILQLRLNAISRSEHMPLGMCCHVLNGRTGVLEILEDERLNRISPKATHVLMINATCSSDTNGSATMVEMTPRIRTLMHQCQHHLTVY